MKKYSFEKKDKSLETLEENFIQMYQPFQRESLTLHKGGIFCYMPYDALDKYEKSIFKIDTSNNIEQKIHDLQQYYPSGFFVIAILVLQNKSKRMHENLQKIVLKRLINQGGKIQTKFEKGWICLEKSIHDAFSKLSIENKGDLNLYHLSGRNKDTFEMIDHQVIDVPTFTGKIVYHT